MAETSSKKKASVKEHSSAAGGGGGAVYGLGFVGALIYFIQHADTFWQGVLGLFQAMVWPAYVVYKLLQSFYG